MQSILVINMIIIGIIISAFTYIFKFYFCKYKIQICNEANCNLKKISYLLFILICIAISIFCLYLIQEFNFKFYILLCFFLIFFVLFIIDFVFLFVPILLLIALVIFVALINFIYEEDIFLTFVYLGLIYFFYLILECISEKKKMGEGDVSVIACSFTCLSIFESHKIIPYFLGICLFFSFILHFIYLKFKLQYRTNKAIPFISVQFLALITIISGSKYDI